VTAIKQKKKCFLEQWTGVHHHDIGGVLLGFLRCALSLEIWVRECIEKKMEGKKSINIQPMLGGIVVSGCFFLFFLVFIFAFGSLPGGKYSLFFFFF